MADAKVPIVVGADDRYTRATSETFRRIAEGCQVEAWAIVWVDGTLAQLIMDGHLRIKLEFSWEHTIS